MQGKYTGIEAEIKQKFTPKKIQNLTLSNCYIRLKKLSRAHRVADCGTFLEFVRVNENEKFKLQRANFCRDRLCPLCAWRRTYKIFGQVSKIMDIIADKFAFLFLTLTVPNCTADKLPSTITRLTNAFHKLVNYKSIKRAVKGYFRALEVTHNTNVRSNSYDTYHPHFHIILAVPFDYFNIHNNLYINHEKWLDLWRRAYGDPTITQVDIRRCKVKEKPDGEQAAYELKKLSSAVAECAKYSVKSTDYLIAENNKMTDAAVTAFLDGLGGRRLCGFGGIFEKVRRELQLDDAENGDLVHVGKDELRSDIALQIVRYKWSCGCYYLIYNND